MPAAYDRRDGGVALGDAPWGLASVDQPLEVGGDLLDDGGEAAVRLPPQLGDRAARSSTDPASIQTGDLTDLVGAPVQGPEVLLQPTQVHEDVDEFAVERRQAVPAREAFHGSAQSGLDPVPRAAHPSDRAVPRPR